MAPLRVIFQVLCFLGLCKLFRKKYEFKEIIFVGIHVRRTDYTEAANKDLLPKVNY